MSSAISVPATTPSDLPPVAALPEETAWLNENALVPFINEVRAERLAEVERIAKHVELSLTEVIQRADEEIGRAAEERDNNVIGAEGRLAQAEVRHAEVMARRDRRRDEFNRQRALTLQGVERLASVLILPHPERETLDVRRLRPHPETEMTAMRVVMEYETAQGRQVEDVHEKNVGYDITSLDPASGELRLIEIKGLARHRQHSADAQRASRRRGPPRMLLALRGDQLRQHPGASRADKRPSPVPVARGH